MRTQELKRSDLLKHLDMKRSNIRVWMSEPSVELLISTPHTSHSQRTFSKTPMSPNRRRPQHQFWRGSSEGGPKQGKRGKCGRKVAVRSVELTPTRSNTTVPIPKVYGRNLEIGLHEVSPDAHLPVQWVQVCNRAGCGTVEGQ